MQQQSMLNKFIQLMESINFYLLIMVKGISESEKEKIFDEHFTTKKQGMGLGLSLAKRLMNKFKG